MSDPLTWEDLPQLMDELRDMARRLLAGWSGMQSLQATLLVNAALVKQRRSDQSWDDVSWESRDQLFGQVFRAMRQVLTDYRRQQKGKRHQIQRRISVTEMEALDAWRCWTEDPELARALDRTLERLKANRPECAEIVEYRFFAGLTWSEIAKMRRCSLATVKRHWGQTRVQIEALLREERESD